MPKNQVGTSALERKALTSILHACLAVRHFICAATAKFSSCCMQHLDYDFIRFRTACLHVLVLCAAFPSPTQVPQPTPPPSSESPFDLIQSYSLPDSDLLCCRVGLHDLPPLCLLYRQHPDRLRGDSAGVNKLLSVVQSTRVA